ncbi:unnamed protein product [Phytophthora fragariaefolia]|uniref:Unnamed protein product n=1 Tax=Phytophthora fragariaefolia TaxID=1490495 RepID=A0A9W7D3N7_9STRA|nr:unnamed protein product [Phytophthora fragariaefolia]
MLHAEHVCCMGATFPDEDVLVIDLAALFWWSVSESSDNEAFFGYECVDDNIVIEPDRDFRLDLAEATLRLSMMAVLGPDSINDSKFLSWSIEQQALGLIWNIVDITVTVPPDKIQKGFNRVSVLPSSTKVIKQQLQQLLGSLRHITTCLRSAKTFFQQFQSLIADAEATGFSINVREHFCMALAAWCWGPHLHQDLNYPHVVCWNDNVSTVSWTHRLHSNNVFAQEINRVIGLAEAVFRFRLSARHPPGAINRMTDAGSRAWPSPYS